MIVILPYKGQTLANMLQMMSQNPFSTIIDRLDKVKDEFEGEDVKVYLPRFAAKSDLTLNTVLEKVEFEEEKNITSTNKRLSISDGNNRRVRPRDS
jgi:serine protease inhibitor